MQESASLYLTVPFNDKKGICGGILPQAPERFDFFPV